MEGRFWVIGIGPGTEEYLTRAAVRAVEEADLLIGGPRALALFRHLGKPEVTIRASLEAVAATIRENCCRCRVAVLLSGDPGFFGMLNYLRRHFPPEQMVVIPGISSVQLAFARLGRSWENVRFVSLHGRPLAILEEAFREAKTLAVLTDPVNSPDRVARFLLEKGLGSVLMHVLNNLGYPDELIIAARPEEVCKYTNLHNAVLVIDHE